MSKEKPFKTGETFATGNTMLAAALTTAGVPFADPRKPMSNIYTEERLGELRCATVAEAMRKKLPGKVTYFFKSTPNLQKLLKAFSDTVEAIRLAGEGEEVSTPDLDVTPEEVVRIAAQGLANRAWFAENWCNVEPIAKIVTGEKSFVLVSRNASKKTRKHLGIE